MDLWIKLEKSCFCIYLLCELVCSGISSTYIRRLFDEALMAYDTF